MNKLNNLTTIAMLAGLGLVGTLTHAETDAELMASGQWRDPATGLIWLRCAIGQGWNGNTCTGDMITLNAKDANTYIQQFVNGKNLAGHQDWRVPDFVELVGLRRCSQGWKRGQTKYQDKRKLTEQGYVTEWTTIPGEVLTVMLPNGKLAPWACNMGSGTDVFTGVSLDPTIFPNKNDKQGLPFLSATSATPKEYPSGPWDYMRDKTGAVLSVSFEGTAQLGTVSTEFSRSLNNLSPWVKTNGHLLLVRKSQ